MAYQDELRSYFSKMATLFKDDSMDENATYSPQDMLEILSCILMTQENNNLTPIYIKGDTTPVLNAVNFVTLFLDESTPLGAMPLDFLFQWMNDYKNIGTFFCPEGIPLQSDNYTLTWDLANIDNDFSNINSYKLCHLQMENFFNGEVGVEIVGITNFSSADKTGDTILSLPVYNDKRDPGKNLFIWLKERDKSQEVTNNG